MPLTNAMKTLVFNQLIESTSEINKENIYVGLSNGTNQTYSDSIPFKNNLVQTLQSFQKILSSDFSYVIPRNDYVVGNIYDFWDPDNQNRANSIVVVNSGGQYGVFVCLSNNLGNVSTDQPTITDLTSSSIETNFGLTSDGYVWLHLYTLTEQEEEKFLSDSYVPVRQSIDIPRPDGEILWVNVLDKGNCFDGQTVHFSTSSNTGSGFVGKFTMPETITIDSGGTGYRDATIASVSSAVFKPTIPLYGGFGSDFVADCGANTVIVSSIFAGDGGGKFIVGAANTVNTIAIVSGLRLSSDGSYATGHKYTGAEVDVFSASLLHVKQLDSPLQRDAEQTENIKILIQL